MDEPVARFGHWARGPLAPAVDSEQVHVWRTSLEVDDEAIARSDGLLDEDERRRAGCFRFEQHRRLYVASHAILRDILGRYLHTDGVALRFAYNRWGKPSLQLCPSDADIRFNMSHADAVALYAVSLGREVGVDLERLRGAIEVEEIASRFFSPAEAQAVLGHAREHRADAFYACWTRKEAFIKAVGRGVSLPLDEFTVSVEPEGSARLLETAFAPDEAGRWSLATLDPGGGFAGALAAEGEGWTPVLYDHPGLSG